MESSIMKNIVILKNLPSNLVEEAIVLLKENERIHIEDFASRENNKKNENEYRYEDNGYIVKEAELLISDYIKDIETRKNEKKQNIWKTKYKKSKFLNIFLGIVSIAFVIKNLF